MSNPKCHRQCSMMDGWEITHRLRWWQRWSFWNGWGLNMGNVRRVSIEEGHWNFECLGWEFLRQIHILANKNWLLSKVVEKTIHWLTVLVLIVGLLPFGLRPYVFGGWHLWIRTVFVTNGEACLRCLWFRPATNAIKVNCSPTFDLFSAPWPQQVVYDEFLTVTIQILAKHVDPPFMSGK